MESMNQSDLYQQMNALLNEREEIFRKKEQESKAFQEELRRKEAELYESKRLLELEKQQLEADKEKLRMERKEMSGRWEELEKYKENLSEDMKRILKEKLELQALNNERLRQESEKESMEREQIRSELGITVTKKQEDAVVVPEKEKEEERDSESEEEKEVRNSEPEEEKEARTSESETEEEVPEQVEKIPDDQAQDVAEEKKELPQIMQAFVEAAKVIFPEGRTLEISEEMLCLELEDKELRILKGSPSNAMILARREKSLTLKAGIKKLNQMQSEWEFSYEDNYLRCTMPFTEATPVEVVLQSCAAAMKQYFK